MKNRKFILPLILAAGYLWSFFFKRESFLGALDLLRGFLTEMVQVMPGVLILTGLIAVWVPREMVLKSFGKGSGIKGKLLSLLTGSISAGPIYAAFPLCLTLYRKGASAGNLVVIISSWAVIKVPMIFMETQFLGGEFAFYRYVLTLPAIFIMAYFMEKAGPEVIVPPEEEEEAMFPGYNCKACGYGSCRELEEAVKQGKKGVEACMFTGSSS